VILDPPYSDEEAEWLYGTPKLRPARYTAEAVRVCRVGGHVAVYHNHQPKRPRGTKLTGHAPRLCFVFEKMTDEEIAAFRARRMRAVQTASSGATRCAFAPQHLQSGQ
jgi:hypothetical protein